MRHPGAEPIAVLTGDSLFIGDVGRPDLVNLQGSTTADLARAMYHTIHDKLLTLPARDVMPRTARIFVRQEPLHRDALSHE